MTDLSFASGVLSIVLAVLGGALGGATILMPGWLLQTVFNRGVRSPATAEPVFVASTTFAGLLVHAILSPWTASLILRTWADGVKPHVVEVVAWFVVALIVAPPVIGAAGGRLCEMVDHPGFPAWAARPLRRLGLSIDIRTADAWTWRFRRFAGEEGAYVRLRLKDLTTVVWGRFGMKSFAASDGAVRDIYLESRLVVTNGALSEVPSTRGVWVSGDQIASIEFYSGNAPQQGGRGLGETDLPSRVEKGWTPAAPAPVEPPAPPPDRPTQ